MAQSATKKKSPRGIYSIEDEEADWLKNRLVFDSKAECTAWMEAHVNDREHPSNPEDPHLEHIFTFLTSWNQIETYLLKKLDEIDRNFPPSIPPKVSPNNIYQNGFLDTTNDMVHNQKDVEDVPPNLVQNVMSGLKHRLDYPIHSRLNRQATMNSLSYLYHHMRCGIFIVIRQGKVRMFVPFVNAKYENTWSSNLKWNCKHSEGAAELKQDVTGYYEEKRSAVGGREENVIPRVKEWWLNGNIVCNEHCPPGQTHSQYWGDQLLVPLRDMFHHLCEERQVADCEFFINKRDYPHLKVHVCDNNMFARPNQEVEGHEETVIPVEPYGFVFDRDDRDPLQDVALSRHKHKHYAPIASFYCGSPLRFADLPLPTSEDWEAATGLVYPPSFKREVDKKDGKLKFNNPRDLFTEENFRKFDCAWTNKRNVAFFRGTATGGGITTEDNQRLKCASLCHRWEHPEDGVECRKGLLDAAITGWNKRDKKVFGKQMSCLNPKDFPFTAGKHHFVPIYEQSAYKYLIYIDGHCAACRYAFMMRLGSVILKVESNGVADRMWYFPLLRPWYDHVPVLPDLSDLDVKIRWCIEHDEQCQVIANNAKKIYDKYMNENGILDYLEVFCSEISNRFEYAPKWWERPASQLGDPPCANQPTGSASSFTASRFCSGDKYCARCEAERRVLLLEEEEEEEAKKKRAKTEGGGSRDKPGSKTVIKGVGQRRKLKKLRK